jgi:hypothetical protein
VPVPTCTDELRKLYDAIISLKSGKSVTSINYGERSVQYAQNQLKELQQLYGIFYRQCGADSGLIDLSAGNMVERGPPMRILR